MKKVFTEISYPNLIFFSDLWRILIPLGFFSYAYYCLKCNFRSFPQSLDDAKHVCIELMGIKNFCWNKSFHRNFWPKLGIPHRSNMRKVHFVPALSVKKNFLRHFFKNPFPQFCRAWSGEQIKYPQHANISWIES